MASMRVGCLPDRPDADQGAPSAAGRRTPACATGWTRSATPPARGCGLADAAGVLWAVADGVRAALALHAPSAVSTHPRRRAPGRSPLDGTTGPQRRRTRLCASKADQQGGPPALASMAMKHLSAHSAHDRGKPMSVACRDVVIEVVRQAGGAANLPPPATAQPRPFPNGKLSEP